MPWNGRAQHLQKGEGKENTKELWAKTSKGRETETFQQRRGCIVTDDRWFHCPGSVLTGMGVSHGSFPEGWDHRAGPSSRSTSSHHSPVPPSSHPFLAICPCPLPGPHGSPPALLQLALALTNAATNLPTSAQPQPWNAACFQEVLKLLRWKFFEDPVVVFFFFFKKSEGFLSGNITTAFKETIRQGQAVSMGRAQQDTSHRATHRALTS